MASKHLSLLFLFLVISTLQVHARDSQFFSKVIPNNNNNNNNFVDEVKDTQLTPQREEDLPRFTQESRNGYGLYGHDEIQNPQFNEVPNGDSSSSNLPVGDEFAAGHEKFEFNNNNENYENRQFRENGYKGRQNNMPDNLYNNNNNNYDGYKSEEFNNNRFRDEQFMSNNNGYKGNNNNNNNNYNEFRTEEFNNDNNNNNNNNNANKGGQFNNNNNNNNMFQNERQGMSDTRFLEHGRYYYNAKNDNLTPNREFGSGSSDREVEYSRNQYYNGGFNNGNNNNNKNINDDDFDP